VEDVSGFAGEVEKMAQKIEHCYAGGALPERGGGNVERVFDGRHHADEGAMLGWDVNFILIVDCNECKLMGGGAFWEIGRRVE
jgi:hypothetical protein